MRFPSAFEIIRSEQSTLLCTCVSYSFLNFCLFILAVLGPCGHVGFPLGVAAGATLSLQHLGLLRWRPLLQSTGARAHGLQQLQRVSFSGCGSQVSSCGAQA